MLKFILVFLFFLFIGLFLIYSMIIDDIYSNNKIDKLSSSLTKFNNISLVQKDYEEKSIKIKEITNDYNINIDVDSLSMLIYDMSIKYETLSVELICATISHESAHTWNPRVESPVGAIGLMQIMPYTGRFLAIEEGYEWNRETLYNWKKNIILGCRYLNYMIELFGVSAGLAGYNAGPNNARKYYASNNINVLPEETQKYIPSVVSLYRQYRRL